MWFQFCRHEGATSVKSGSALHKPAPSFPGRHPSSPADEQAPCSSPHPLGSRRARISLPDACCLRTGLLAEAVPTFGMEGQRTSTSRRTQSDTGSLRTGAGAPPRLRRARTSTGVGGTRSRRWATSALGTQAQVGRVGGAKAWPRDGGSAAPRGGDGALGQDLGTLGAGLPVV